MPSYTRPSKSTGQTVFIDNVPLPASDLEAEFTAINTALGLCAAASGIDASSIDDYSATATEQKTQTDPGTGSSLSPATTLEEEIARLRYTISRLGLGVTVPYRYDGSSNVACAWVDYPARAENLATNGGFELKTTGSTAAPDGWTLVSTPTTCAQATPSASQGKGKSIRIVADASNDGISQTFAGLKAGTRYLVLAKALASVGTAKLTVTGADATSQFRDITLTSASASWTTLSAIIQTDSTPTDIVVSLLATSASDDVEFDHFGIYECSQDVNLTPRGYVATSSVTTSTGSHYTVGSPADSGCSVTVVAPAPGYVIRVQGSMPVQNSGGSNANLQTLLKQNGSAAAVVGNMALAGGVFLTATVEFVNSAPVPGTAYTYTMEGQTTNVALDRNPTLSLGTATTYIRAWVERL